MRRGSVRRLGAMVVALVASGCTTLAPPVVPDPVTIEGPFDHADFDRVLGRFVDDHGRVDYMALLGERRVLDRYLGQLAAASPDSHPDLFPSEADRLAYWINAYNAGAIALVLEHYPIDTVRDERRFTYFFLPRGAGFFVFQRIRLGRELVNLYDLENRIVRKRFDDPRIHFALNCASRGCPRLPSEAFDPKRLDEQLERETRRFFSEERNLRVDTETGTLRLSSILAWYRGDFTGWLVREAPDEEATLAAYAARYASDATRDAIESAGDLRVGFERYDWRLNDQHPRR